MIEADVVVVGLGGLGSAAAYWSARSGATVIGIEQFELGHVRGASHDHSRIIRRSYHTPAYVRLTAEAYDAWTELERDAGAPVVTRTGGIDLFPVDAAIDPGSYRDSLDAVGVPYEWLDATEIRRRWPAFARGTVVDEGVHALYSADTGIVPAGPATALLQRQAVAHGADLRPHQTVRAIEPERSAGGEITVRTDDGDIRGGAVVVCADAWTNRLLAPLGHRVELAVTREQVSYFPTADRDDLAIGAFPVWIWMDDPSFYGFPAYGPPGVADRIKGSEDCGGELVDPDTRTFEPDAQMERRLGEFMAALVGDRFGPPATTTCLYTLTPDRDFVLDRLPDHPNVVVGLGAAHGFKFASWFGRRLAGLARGDERSDDLRPFVIDRAGIDAPIDRSAWLV